jgi:hypothetical protein
MATNAETALVPVQQYPDVPISTGTGRGVQFEPGGPLYVSIADVTEFFGVRAQEQLRRLQKDPTFALGLMRGSGITTPQGRQTMWFIRADLVSGWLYQINPRKVSEDRRRGLMAYREACTKVLNDYITGSVTAPPSPAQRIVEPAPMQRTPDSLLINEYAAIEDLSTQTIELTVTLQKSSRFYDQWRDSMRDAYEQSKELTARLGSFVEATENSRNPKRHGWVYVLHDPQGRRYKIGMTQNPDLKKRKREVEGQWGKDQAVQVVWIETDNIHLERLIQAHYKRRKKHLNDEWFRLSPDDIERLRGLGSFVQYRDFDTERLDAVAVAQTDLFGGAV